MCYFTATELFALTQRYEHGFVCPAGYETNLVYFNFETKWLKLEPWGESYRIGLSDDKKILGGGFDLIGKEFDCEIIQELDKIELTIIPINNRGERICMILMGQKS